MALVRVHNISTVAQFVSGEKVRPGKSIEVDSSKLTHERQNPRLFVGDRPPARAPAPPPAAASGPMTLEEVRSYLAEYTLGDLQELCTLMTPALTYPPHISREGLLFRLSRALFQPERELDPGAFFWTRRWRKGYEVFEPVE